MCGGHYTVQRHTEGPDANGATHTERGPGPSKTRAKPHNGTDPHTGQNGGQAQDTPTRVGRALYCLYEYKTYE